MKKLFGIVICLSLLTSLIAGAVACAEQQETTTAGTIRSIDQEEKTFTFEGNVFQITDTTEITLDANKASLNDLKTGMPVVVVHKGVKAIKVDAKTK